MTITQGFFRPIETPGIRVLEFSGEVGGTPFSYNSFADGVNACILTILNEIQTELSTSYSITLTLTDDFCVRLEHATDNISIDMNAAARMLGFTSFVAATSRIVVAPYHPLYCWFPTHHSYDGSRWWRDQGKRFAGELGSTGGKFGVTLPTRYRRDFMYSTNYSEGTYHEAERNYYTLIVDYYPRAERSFEEFIDGATNAQRTLSTSGNTSPKGCYYIDRAYEYCGTSPTRTLPATMDAGDIHFDLDNNTKRDNYLFCQIDGNTSPPAQTDSRLGSYYQPQFSLVSDVTPDTIAWATGGAA
jgi:hypothetical protein